MGDIPVRRFDHRDFDALYKIVPKLWSEEGIRPENHEWEETSKTFLTSQLGKTAVGVVAVNPSDHSQLIACGFGVIWSYIPSFWNVSGECGYLQWFYTAPEFRGRGIGTAMVNEIMDWYEARNVTRVFMNAAGEGVSFWEKFGFEIVDEFPQMFWVKPGTDIDRSGAAPVAT